MICFKVKIKFYYILHVQKYPTTWSLQENQEKLINVSSYGLILFVRVHVVTVVFGMQEWSLFKLNMNSQPASDRLTILATLLCAVFFFLLSSSLLQILQGFSPLVIL